MIDLKQKELAEWERKNFPTDHLKELTKDQLIDIILILQVTLGLNEEAGEVAHHVLKGTQKIRGGVNGINKDQIVDGVTDQLVFGLQLLSKLQINAEETMPQIIDQVLNRNWLNNPNNGESDAS